MTAQNSQLLICCGGDDGKFDLVITWADLFQRCPVEYLGVSCTDRPIRPMSGIGDLLLTMLPERLLCTICDFALTAL